MGWSGGEECGRFRCDSPHKRAGFAQKLEPRSLFLHVLGTFAFLSRWGSCPLRLHRRFNSAAQLSSRSRIYSSNSRKSSGGAGEACTRDASTSPALVSRVRNPLEESICEPARVRFETPSKGDAEQPSRFYRLTIWMPVEITARVPRGLITMLKAP